MRTNWSNNQVSIAFMSWIHNSMNHHCVISICAVFTKYTRGEKCTRSSWPGPSLQSPCPSCGSQQIWEAWTLCRPDPWWTCDRGSLGPAGRSSSRTPPLTSVWMETKVNMWQHISEFLSFRLSFVIKKLQGSKGAEVKGLHVVPPWQ